MKSQKSNQTTPGSKPKFYDSSAFAWTLTLLSALGLMVSLIVFAEYKWASGALAVLLIVSLGLLVRKNLKSLRGRTAAYGLHAAVTVILVICLVGVLNFLGHRFQKQFDLTQNKIHTLSDQTEKLVKGLKEPVKFVVFDKSQGSQKVRPLLENLKAISSKVEIEYVDPDREPSRAKQVNVKRYGTLQVIYGTKEQKIEDANEEKLTQALIKVTQDKTQTLCFLTGHGEKSSSSVEPEGYSSVKKGLEEQSYSVKEINLTQEGQLDSACQAIAVVGPQKSYLPSEVKLIQDYLNQGGRALFALDLNVKGTSFAPELVPLLQEWNIRVNDGMVVDPFSKMMGVDASVPIIAQFSKESPITRDMTAQCYFPLTRSVESAGKTDLGLNPVWLGQTTPKSWEVSDLKALATGRVQYTPGKDKNGPLSVAMSVEGKKKDSKATRNTRVVVFGTSYFATNHYSRLGANVDFFLNSISWILEDENLISIRAKEEGAGRIELTEKQGRLIFLIAVIFVPFLIALSGIVIWVRRKKL